jgi:hypothetical protein
MFGLVGIAIVDHLRTARDCQGLFFSECLLESVRTACQQLQYEFRERIYSPAVTLWVFLAQVLSADHSCREAVAKLNFWRLARGLSPASPDTNSYCEARQRLPESLFSTLVRATGRELTVRADAAWHWCGRAVKVVDGSTITLPDTPRINRPILDKRLRRKGSAFPSRASWWCFRWPWATWSTWPSVPTGENAPQKSACFAVC